MAGPGLCGSPWQRRLVRVLGRHTGPAQEAHLLYAPRRYQPLRVRVLVDFLSERVAKLPGAAPVPSSR